MKTLLTLRNSIVASLLLVGALNLPAQGTAFTYQGRLTTNGATASGVVELQCTVWDALSGGAQVAAATPASTIVNITNGLFTVALDFGVAAFDGSDRYLQIEARTTLGPYTLLTPRQKITATPYALLAGKLSGTLTSSGLIGTYGNAVTFSNTANVFNGSFTGNGGGLTNLNAASLGGVNASNIWKTTGNAGTTAGMNFFGTTDNQPLELKANGQRALRLEPLSTVTNVYPAYSVILSNSVNVLGGSSANVLDAGVFGSFVGGGGLGGYYVNTGTVYYSYGSAPNRVSAHFSAIVGGNGNTIQTNADASTIGGGSGNSIQTGAHGSTIGGGAGNTIQTNAIYATIGGGSSNTIETNAPGSAIGGGSVNRIREGSESATIGGGSGNYVYADYATVPGGQDNYVSGNYGFAAGHSARAGLGCFVWADSSGGFFDSTAPNQFLIRAAGGVGINTASPGSAALAVNGRVAITGGNVLELGFGVAGKEASAGRIGYQTFTADALDIVGAGSTGLNNRKIKFWCEAGATFTGVITAPSDRKLKQDFQSLNTLEVLDQVVAMPVQRWSYKSDATKRHIGPVAQDFHAAFGLNGDDDEHIATVDADGVALAAIQGLNEKVEAGSQKSEVRIQKLEAENAELKQRLERLERLMNRKAK